jgi:hypothetical protein
MSSQDEQRSHLPPKSPMLGDFELQNPPILGGRGASQELFELQNPPILGGRGASPELFELQNPPILGGRGASPELEEISYMSSQDEQRPHLPPKSPMLGDFELRFPGDEDTEGPR